MDRPARIGRYRLLHEVARGGTGVVYRAADDQTGTDVAVKLLLAGRKASPLRLVGPGCEWALSGGRVYMTAIGALTLEVYYRYERRKD